MEPATRAVIDIGTNSVKLLVAEVSGAEVSPVWEGSYQTRLGQGFYSSHRLQTGPIAKTAEAVAEFAAKARQYGAKSVRVIATSAAREAINRDELVAAIQHSSGLQVQVISGEQEADWAYQGICTDAQLANAPVMLLDVGGGSTEFILGHGGRKDFRSSYALGSVRLLEQIQPSDPPKPAELAACRRQLQEFFKTKVQPEIAAVLQPLADSGVPRDDKPDYSGPQLVGTGGTASILGCMEAKLDRFDRERLEATRLAIERLKWHVDHLWSLSLEQRKQIVGLPQNRADVILTGAAIYESVAQVFGFRELRVSTRGLRFAAVAA